MMTKIPETLSEYAHVSMDSRKVSYVGLQWQNPHQDTQNPPNPQCLDIIDLIGHPDYEKIPGNTS